MTARSVRTSTVAHCSPQIFDPVELAVCKALANKRRQSFCIVGLPPSDLPQKMLLTQCAACATDLG